MTNSFERPPFIGHVQLTRCFAQSQQAICELPTFQALPVTYTVHECYHCEITGFGIPIASVLRRPRCLDAPECGCPQCSSPSVHSVPLILRCTSALFPDVPRCFGTFRSLRTSLHLLPSLPWCFGLGMQHASSALGDETFCDICAVFQSRGLHRRPFPAFPDFLEEVRSTWNRPASAASVLNWAALLATLEGVGVLDLVEFPPVDSTWCKPLQ
ncbi:UNVERIFIED_CONTAM: hypothetical protein FKN15_075050 [Acipenser sinensis]